MPGYHTRPLQCCFPFTITFVIHVQDACRQDTIDNFAEPLDHTDIIQPRELLSDWLVWCQFLSQVLGPALADECIVHLSGWRETLDWSGLCRFCLLGPQSRLVHVQDVFFRTLHSRAVVQLHNGWLLLAHVPLLLRLSDRWSLQRCL